MKRDNISDAANLRQKAEGLLKKRLLKADPQPPKVQAQNLIHEFEVCQIELELLYKELKLAKEQAKIASEKYITEHKKAEEELLEGSQERFRSLFENAKIGLYRTTPDGTIILANKALVTMLGYSSFDELVQRNLDLDGFETPNQRKDFLEKIEQSGEVENFETIWIRRDRTPVFVQESARAIRDTNGKTLYYDGTVEDITESRRTKEAQRESETRYRMLFEKSADGILIADVEKKMFTYANPAICRMLGYAEEELTSLGLADIHPEQDLQRVVAEFESVTSGDKTFASDIPCLRKDGCIIYVDINTTSIMMDDRLSAVGLFRDITERKRMREAQRESEERYRLLFETSADGILIGYVETKKVKYANPAICLMLGYTEKELTTMGLADIHPSQDLQRISADFESQTRGEKTLVSNLPCVRKDGSIVYADVNATPIIIDGVPCMIGIFRDITERKRVEDALKSALERNQRQQAAVTSVAISPHLTAGDVQQLAHQLTEHAAKAVNVERVSVWLFNDEGNGLECVDLYELSPDRHSSGFILQQNEYSNEFEALKTAKYIDANDPLTDPRTAGYVEGYLKPLRITSMLDVVIRDGKRNIGALCFEHVEKKHNWEPDEITFASQLADQLSLTVLNHERIQTEQLLRRSEIKLQVILESTADGILAIDNNGKVLRTNNRFAELWKIPTAILNSGDDAVLLDFVLEQLANPKQFLDKVQQLYNSTDEDTDTILFKDGRTFERHSAPLILDDKIIGRVWSFRNITERRLAEETLRNSEYRYRQLVETANEGILVAQDGFFKFVNPKMQEIFGYTHEELMKIPFIELVHPEDRELIMSNYQKIMKGGDIPTHNFRIVKKDGSVRWVDIRGAIIEWEGQIATLSMLTDITEQVQSEKALIDSEYRYRRLIETVNEGILVAQDGFFKFVNPMMLEITGFTQEVLLTRPFIDFVYPEDRELVMSNYLKILDDGQISPRFQFRGVKNDGSIRNIEMSGVLIEWEGRPATLYMITDITEKVQSEKALADSEYRYRQLIENANEGILVAQNGFLKFVNPKMQEIFGYPHEELLTIPFFEFLYPEDRELVMSTYQKRIKGDPIVPKHHFRIVKKDGSVRSIEIHGSVIEWEGQPATLNLLTDITERLQTEKALKDSEARIRALINAIPDLIFRLDKQGVYLDYKANIEDLAIQAETIIGKKNRDILPPEFADLVDEKIELALQTGQMQLFEYQLPMPNKGKCEYEARMTPSNTDEVIVIVRDVTERKKAEEKLNMLALAVKNSADCIIVTDTDQEIIFTNDSFSQVFGYKNEEIVGLSISVIASTNNLPEVFHAVDSTLAKKKVWSGEIINRRKDGTDIPVQLSIAPVLNDKGGVVAFVGILRDITERRQADEALRNSEHRYRQLVENANDGILVAQDGFLKFANSMMIKLTGYTPEELFTIPFIDFVFPEDREKVMSNHQKRMKGEKSISRYHLRIVRSDRNIRWVETNGAIIEWEGKTASLNFFNDITERLQSEKALVDSEQRYRLLIETANEGILVTQDGFFKFVNPKMQEILGYTHKELLKIPFIDLVHPEDRELIMSNYQKIMKGGDIPRHNFRIVKKDGSVRWVDISGAIIEWEGQIATLSMLTDITEHFQAEEEIRLKNDQLVKLNTEKDKFFSIIAHDLRSPFNSFLGLTQIMAEDLPSLNANDIQKIAEVMNKSATSLYRLLENLLQWSGMQQGLLPFDLEDVHLLSVVKESLEMIVEPAKNKGIEITYDIPDNLKVFADNNMLQTVFRNLVSNAVKFTHKGGKVNISAKTTGGQNVEISISDTGIGMTNEMIDNLFSIDVKTNRKGTEDEPSTGLGLLLCKEFVERHGGKIWVESEVGNGSTFYFTIC